MLCHRGPPARCAVSFGRRSKYEAKRAETQVRRQARHMKNSENQRSEEKKTRGFWSTFLKWWCIPSYSRSDPRVMLILVIVALASMIFGGGKGIVVGSLLLWYLASIIIPALWGEGLCRRFGPKFGMIIALAPIWLPIALLLSSGLWIDIFRK
jgi:hypothetical protein